MKKLITKMIVFFVKDYMEKATKELVVVLEKIKGYDKMGDEMAKQLKDIKEISEMSIKKTDKVVRWNQILEQFLFKHELTDQFKDWVVKEYGIKLDEIEGE